jgi:hypothetical protein
LCFQKPLKNLGAVFGGRDWGATSPKRGTNKTRPSNVRSDTVWWTLWGHDWRCNAGQVLQQSQLHDTRIGEDQVHMCGRGLELWTMELNSIDRYILEAGWLAGRGHDLYFHHAEAERCQFLLVRHPILCIGFIWENNTV